MFEFLEYSLEHQLPNFSECWWDHWIMDVIVCNGAGIYMGMKTLKFLQMKPYRWRSLWTIPTYSGKLNRNSSQGTKTRSEKFTTRAKQTLYYRKFFVTRVNFFQAHTNFCVTLPKFYQSMTIFSRLLSNLQVKFNASPLNSPHTTWVEFDWRPTSSIKRWMFTVIIVALILVAELNCFYLKFILWIPPPHYLNLLRLLLMLLTGAVALRETFQYLDDPTCKKFGRQSWMILFILATEVLIIVRFDYPLVAKPFPPKIAWSWRAGVGVLVLWTLWEFFVKRWTFRLKDHRRSSSVVAMLNDEPLMENGELEQDGDTVKTNDFGPLEFSTVKLRRRVCERCVVVARVYKQRWKRVILVTVLEIRRLKKSMLRRREVREGEKNHTVSPFSDTDSDE